MSSNSNDLNPCFDFQEVNDVLQRVSGESQPVPLWRTASTEDLDNMKEKEFPLLYSFRLNLKVTGSQVGFVLNSGCNMSNTEHFVSTHFKYLEESAVFLAKCLEIVHEILSH